VQKIGGSLQWTKTLSPECGGRRRLPLQPLLRLAEQTLLTLGSQ